ncbi:MAG: 1-acyl-sn-glycerol-3-phosphate acyltransferase [Christensenellaceae bacterium]|nr:1-acyl-sn-glycerol-3-phosphate acyltransferase [Christensenellaceae bacterium]
MLYQILRLIGKPVIYLLFWPKIIGKMNTRHKGRAVVIANHFSFWDPLLIAVIFKRQVYWMGKIELFKSRIARMFFNAVKAFPVRRGEGDLAAIRHAFRILKAEKLFGIFPEGTRIKSGEIGRFEPGTAMIALKNNAPVIPVYIKGQYKLFRRMKVIIGEPIMLSDYVGSKTDQATVEAATRFLENKLKDMRNTTF